MCSSRRRKTRTKTRKPKFLSLRDQLAPPQPESSNMQLDLFPLHPDNDPHVACLLEQDHEADGGATITALFGGSSSSSAVFDEVPSPASSTMNWDGDGLARRALRGRERWVFCRSSSSSEEEVVSSGGCVDLWRGVRKGLSLKLDYEEILTAWSDRGSLYIDGEGPQVVPELQQNSYEDDSIAPNVLVEVGNCGGWRVPEVEEVVGEKSSSREARVMRYKEKRRSRLFSKRIRYEVRKLNAEKRPRIKGRFVKRNDDM